VVDVRVVVIGAGGIGGSIGARLHQSGCDVALVARGAHGEAVREGGLTFATPEERVTLRIPSYSRPDELTWTADDVVVLATKSQDTEAAAVDLFAATGPDVPVVSAQNGVANERALSRWFTHVHGMCVMMPTAHLEPGVVMAHSAAATGILDLGRFPEGTDDVDQALAAALRASRIESVPRPDIMRWKYRKLVNNLGNAVQALCGTGLGTDAASEILDLLVAEAEQAFAAAGVDTVTEAEDDVRRGDHLQLRPIAGEPRGGGSTWQSLLRGTGVETDFLNGEIALLGRLYDVPTPVNAQVQRLMREAATRGAGPGSLSAEDLLAAVTD
jgi:2-dehydropantoate 2-reductase